MHSALLQRSLRLHAVCCLPAGRWPSQRLVGGWSAARAELGDRARRAQVSAQQLRDDLLSMLVAGHETTGSVLTWTLYLLAQNAAAMAKVRRGAPCRPRIGLAECWVCAAHSAVTRTRTISKSRPWWW
jgi:hypothetical protein